MLALLGLATLASFIASAVLGVRLLRLAARSRQAPEALLGCAFLLAGVLGYALMLVGAGGADAIDPVVAERFFFAGYALISLGVVLTYAFVWRVFRPTSRVAAVVTWVLAGLVLATAGPWNLRALSGDEPLTGWALVFFWLGHAARVACGSWGAGEAARTWWAMRRRLRLGLADPVVVNRIGLWGLASLGAAVIFLSTAISNASGASMGEVMTPTQVALISTVTLSVAIAQWLAFFPPARYLAWLSPAPSLEGAAPPKGSPRSHTT